MEITLPVSLVIKSALIREGLRRILIDYGFQVQQAVAQPDSLDTAAIQDEHILISDWLAFSKGSVSSLAGLFAHDDKVRVIRIADKLDIDGMRKSFEDGVYACVMQDIHPESFVSIVQLVSLGEKVAPTELINTIHRLPTEPQAPESLASYKLNAREMDVLDRLAMGMSNKRISRDLELSEATVKLAIKSIFRKMHVKNRTQAALIARDKIGMHHDNPPAHPENSVHALSVDDRS